jgi:hypothetical protein
MDGLLRAQAGASPMSDDPPDINAVSLAILSTDDIDDAKRIAHAYVVALAQSVSVPDPHADDDPTADTAY